MFDEQALFFCAMHSAALSSDLLELAATPNATFVLLRACHGAITSLLSMTLPCACTSEITCTSAATNRYTAGPGIRALVARSQALGEALLSASTVEYPD